MWIVHFCAAKCESSQHGNWSVELFGSYLQDTYFRFLIPHPHLAIPHIKSRQLGYSTHSNSFYQRNTVSQYKHCQAKLWDANYTVSITRCIVVSIRTCSLTDRHASKSVNASSHCRFQAKRLQKWVANHRSPYDHLCFDSNIHQCIGISSRREHIEATLSQLSSSI